MGLLPAARLAADPERRDRLLDRRPFGDFERDPLALR